MKARRVVVWLMVALTVGVVAVLAAGQTVAAARTYADEEVAFLRLINECREDNGVGPLLLSDMLSVAAVRHNSDMAGYGFFGHNTVASDYFPCGSTPFDRMSLCGYDYATDKGENIAAGYQTAAAVLDAWLSSDAHRRELLRSCYKVIGISRFYRADSKYGYYWTVDLGGYVDPTAQDGMATTTSTTVTTIPTSTTTIPTTPTTGPASPFTDVPLGSPYYEAVVGMHDAGIITGYAVAGHLEFRPEAAVIRAQFAKMVCGVFGVAVSEELICRFSDVGPDITTDLYPDDFVAAAALSGIALGVGDNKFAPWVPISRVQVVSMIVRGAQQFAADALRTPPAGYDCAVPGSGDPAHDANMALAEYSGLLEGVEGAGSAWNPWAQASRGEVAQMLWNVMR